MELVKWMMNWTDACPMVVFEHTQATVICGAFILDELVCWIMMMPPPWNVF